MAVVKLSKKKIYDDIMHEAKVLGMKPGLADLIADKVVEKIMIWGKKRSAVTELDLNERLAKEIKKFNEDLAYLFESRGRIM